MIQLHQLDNSYHFPPTDNALAEPNGLLAFGGDLSVGRLIAAYRQGIFPWFSKGEPILWWSPSPRAVIELGEFYCSKSLRKLIKQARYELSMNRAFDQVIEACATVPRNAISSPQADNATWITEQMLDAYKALHRAGNATSIEVWDQNKLVGGLYGVTLGPVFCGESMFHTASNASKLALWALVNYMTKNKLAFIDCQIQNPHLQSLGCKTISRDAFLDKLQQAYSIEIKYPIWQSQPINYT